jgi:hypothetical protein
MLNRLATLPTNLTFGLAFAIHLLVSLYYGQHIPWGGDEWFSYNDFTLSGLPFSVQVWISKILLPPLDYTNYSIYRATNFIWSFLSFFLLYKIVTKYPQWKGLGLVFLAYMTISPFVMGMEQFYRYYNLYLFASLGWFWLILLYDHRFQTHRIPFYLAAFASIFIHFLLFWGIAVYILFKEISLLKTRWQWASILVLTAGVTVFILFGSPLLKWVFELAGGGNYELPDKGNFTRGFSKALLIKPFFALFAYVFGEKTLPLESNAVNFFYVLSLLVLAIGLIQLVNKKALLRLIFTAGIIPFLGLFWFVEPLTLPGMTQFEPKHPMFALPWIIFLWFQVIKSDNVYFSILGLSPLIAGVFGLYYSLRSPQIDWKAAIQTLEAHQGAILHDPSAKSDLLFFGEDQIDTNLLIGIYDTSNVNAALQQYNQCCIATLDFKSYQFLSMEQMWNSGSDSGGRFVRINKAYTGIQNKNFSPVNSYINHPLIINCFKKAQVTNTDSLKTVNPIPWFFGMPYKDLRWPLTIKNEVKKGFYPLRTGANIAINSNAFLYFLKVPPGSSKSAPIAKIYFNDGSSQLLKLKQGSDPYQEHFTAGFEGSEVVYRWHKRPLVSSSHAYPGSMFPSTGNIYEWKSNKMILEIEVLQEGVELNYVL